jgi:hypothetical protein
MSSSHYRALSVTGLASSSSNLARRTSLDVKTDSLPLSNDPSNDLLADAYARRPRLPRNYRWLRASAVAGWSLAAVLFLVLVLSHPSIAPNVPSSLNLGGFGGMRSQAVEAVEEVATSARGKVDAELAGMVPSAQESKAAVASKGAKKLPPSGLQAPVSIVSSFYRVDNGKKHRVSGSFSSSPHSSLTFMLTVLFPTQSTTNGSRTSFTPLNFPSFSTVLLRWRLTSRTFAATRCVHMRSLSPSVLMRFSLQPLTLITNYTSPFEMPPLQNLGGHAWAEAQHKIDPEKHVHVPDVYGVWTAKPWIVANAAELNPYGSEYFFWVRSLQFP